MNHGSHNSTTVVDVGTASGTQGGYIIYSGNNNTAGEQLALVTGWSNSSTPSAVSTNGSNASTAYGVGTSGSTLDGGEVLRFDFGAANQLTGMSSTGNFVGVPAQKATFDFIGWGGGSHTIAYTIHYSDGSVSDSTLVSWSGATDSNVVISTKDGLLIDYVEFQNTGSGAGYIKLDSVTRLSGTDILDLVEGPNGDGAVNVTTATALNDAVNLLGGSSVTALGSDVISGGAGNDVIFGDAPNTDTLAQVAGLSIAAGSGWAVFQQLEAHASNTPEYHNWTRDDTINYILTHQTELAKEAGRSNGNDTIDGGGSDDFIFGQEGNDTIHGGSGNDIINGGSGADILNGDAGNDTFLLANGEFAAGESIDGGADSDTIVLTNATTVDFTTGTITSVETLIGSTGNDTVTLSGAQLNGFTSINLGDGTADTINLTSTSTGLNSLSNTALQGVEAISAAGAATGVTINVSNQTEGFTITGSSGANSITGGSGNDTIIGAQSDTLLSGGGGADTLQIGANFTSTSDGQITGIENVTLTTAATLSLANQTEAFTITGSSGADTITGGSGDDSMSAGGGNDTIIGDQNDYVIDGGSGTDTLQVGANFSSTSDGQITGIENVTITGLTGRVVDLSNQTEGFKIIGSSGVDTIVGGGGADTINAGGGNDTLTGNGGADQFRLATNTGTDTITDFQAGIDKIGFLERRRAGWPSTSAIPGAARPDNAHQR